MRFGEVERQVNGRDSSGIVSSLSSLASQVVENVGGAGETWLMNEGS